MNIIILTGNQPRHKYFANTIAESFEISAVFSEGKVFNPSTEDHGSDKKLTDEEKELWKWHFDLAKKEEENFFGSNKNFNIKKVFDVPKGAINSSEWRNIISSLDPDIVIVYGTSLLKDETIDICKDNIINMHLGLSPYYRGSGTNFWPLHNNEPEYVGVTIHRIDKGIDTGPIIHQGRPHIEKNDNQHTIGNKAIVEGTLLMKKTIQEIIDGKIVFHLQTNKGKLYQRKDFSIPNIAHLKKLIENGMIEKYIEKNSKETIFVDIIK